MRRQNGGISCFRLNVKIKSVNKPVAIFRIINQLIESLKLNIFSHT